METYEVFIINLVLSFVEHVVKSKTTSVAINSALLTLHDAIEVNVPKP
jgi:hypothetical protein